MKCDRMPRGWSCSQERGHSGPCPGWPKWYTRIKLAAQLRNPYYLTMTRRQR